MLSDLFSSKKDWSQNMFQSLNKNMPYIREMSFSAGLIKVNVDAIRGKLTAPLIEEAALALLAFELGAIYHSMLPFYDLKAMDESNRFRFIVCVYLYESLKDRTIKVEADWQTREDECARALTAGRYSAFMQLGAQFDKELSGGELTEPSIMSIVTQMAKQINDQTHVLTRDGEVVCR